MTTGSKEMTKDGKTVKKKKIKIKERKKKKEKKKIHELKKNIIQ